MLTASDTTAWEDARPEVREQYAEAHRAFERAVAQRGSTVSRAALAGADTATTLRHGPGGSLTLTDGPLAELTEQIGGFYLLDLPDLDAVVAAAALLPSPYTVEIRPVVEIDGDPPA